MKFDVHRMRGGAIVVDCQSDLIDQFDTRFVIPLVSDDTPVTAMPRLHPRITVAGETMILATHLAAAVPKTTLGPVIARLDEESWTITAALDMLISGY